MKIRCISIITVLLLCCNITSISAFAESYDDLTEGTYNIKTSLSCYINAMGGVEFGAPLLTSSQISVDSNGKKAITLYFTKSNVTIYNVSCDTFIDVSPSYVTDTNGIKSGTLGYYDENNNLITDSVTYTLSDDTAENAQQEQVHFVDSITFPIEYESDKYNLTLFINSNVMGTQFTLDGYTATLSVDWSSVNIEASNTLEENISSTNSITETKAVEEITVVSTTTEKANNKVNIENKDGLNIYSVDQTEPTVSADNQNQPNSYISNFKEPLLIVVGCFAGMMIIVGIILVAIGRKESKK